MRKRILSFLLALVMVLGLLPATAPAASAESNIVAKVEAVGTDYAYDSEEGAYAPIFSSMTAYDPGGNVINETRGNEPFIQSTPFYTKADFRSANKLLSEPKVGETYYFAIYVDQYVNEDVQYDYVYPDFQNTSTATIPGFDVELYSFMEREMGSYLELTYAATKIHEINVGGVGMCDGEYLAVGATKTTTSKPSGGYAYYSDGVLILNNYSYTGRGYCYYSYESSGYSTEEYAAVYSCVDLSVELIGTNTLKPTKKDYSCAIFVEKSALTIDGDGSLTTTSYGRGLSATNKLVINGGTINVNSEEYSGICAKNGSVIINDGDIIAYGGDYGIESREKSVLIYGGTVKAMGENRAISTSTGFAVGTGMERFASTTIDGELGEYTSINFSRYKKIVIEPMDNPFIDVKEDDFFYDPVMWAVQNGITKGVDDTHFGPDQICNRGQVVTFLWRAAGKPEPKSATNPFVDVITSDYFYKPVLWALENNITKGVDDTHFGPDQTCNRGQVVTFLWRAAGKPEPTSSKNPFVDVKSSDFFYKPVLWALEKNITKGVDDTHFGPDQTCNRSQVVTFLYRTFGK